MKNNYDICIITPTYKRYQLLDNNLEKLTECIDNFKICHIILIDGSSELKQYNNIVIKYNNRNYNIRVKNHKTNYGRINFWKTYTELFEETRTLRFKYLISHSDDLLPCNNFFNKIISRFESFRKKNNNYIVMNIHNVKSQKWGVSNYLDGEYIAIPLFLKVLNYKIDKIPESRFTNKPLISTGVHKQITEKIKSSKKYKIVPNNKISYVYPMTETSVMFPSLVRNIKNVNFIDKESM